jgi:hypothetical protein
MASSRSRPKTLSCGRASLTVMSAPADPADPASAPGGAFLAPRPGSEPTDRCFRCGKPTPAGEGLCEEHNPRHLRGPSSTQMHATVFGGIVLGVVSFFVLARLAVGTSGPFATEILAATAVGSGGAAVVFSITNEGESAAMADCRITRDGVPRPDDLAFRAPLLAAGASTTIERELNPEPDSPVAYVPDRLSVVCS